MTFLRGVGVSLLIFFSSVIGTTLGLFRPVSSNQPTVSSTSVTPAQPLQTFATSTATARPPASSRSSANLTLSPQEPTSTLPRIPLGVEPFGCYYQDGGSVALFLDNQSTILPAADLPSFLDLSQFGICFGKDKNHVYQGDNVLPWADPATFSALWYQRGPIIFFRNGTEIIAWSSRVTQEVPPCVTGSCNPYTGPSASSTPFASRSFGNFYIVPGGDPSTFQTFITGYDITPWAKDKNNVYCEGTIIEDADPSTATIVDLTPDTGGYLSVVVKGVNHTYYGCQIVSSSTS